MTTTRETVLSAEEVHAIIAAAEARLAPEADIVRDAEKAVLAKLRSHDIEGVIERAYQEFTDMCHGLGDFAGQPWPEREAFKAHIRRFAYARYHELIGDVLREMRDKGEAG